MEVYMIRTSFFLQRHSKSGIIYFRRAIPKRFQIAFAGKTEIKRSLQTDSKNVALERAIRVNSDLEKQFKNLEVGMDKDCFSKMTVGDITADFGGDVTKELAAIEKVMELRQKLPSSPPQAAPPSSQQGFESKKLVDACKEFRKEKALEGSWRQQTAAEHESSHNLLVQYFGNREISTITLADCRRFKDILMQLPSNMTKGEYRNKTIKQLIAMKPEKTLAPRTINNGYLQRYSSLFHWAARQGYCAGNPFEGLKLSIKRNPIEDRNPFTPQELATIFNRAQYNLEALKTPWKYWIPLIALYTGSRLQEVSQLRSCDVSREEGVHVITITKAAGPLKNTSSERTMPLHPRLIELGFANFVDQARAAGQERLFPELYTTKRIKSGEVAGRWFRNTYLKNVGLLDAGKSFHSIRHNFVDALKSLGIPEHEVAQLTGHKHGSITFGTYGSATPIKALYGVVERLRFDIFT